MITSSKPSLKTLSRNLLAVSVLLVTTTSMAWAEIGTPINQPESNYSTVETRNRAIVQKAFENWRAGGNVFTELLADDVVWTIHGSGPVADTYYSQKDFTERGSGPLVSRLTSGIMPTVRGIMADGDIVIVRFDGSATTTSGKPYHNKFVWMFRMKDDRVVEAEAFLDLVAYQNVVDNNEPRVD